jgi:hypothetical protein
LLLNNIALSERSSFGTGGDITIGYKHRKKKIDLICPLCNLAEETQDRLFMHCPATQTLWFISSLGIHVPAHHRIDTPCWEAPAADTLKINIDAGYMSNGTTC